MSFRDLVPNPLRVLSAPVTAPFQRREGQPWLQGVARNLGHGAFGDRIGNYVDTQMLGDFPGGRRYPAGTPAPTMPQTPALTSQDATNLLLEWLRQQQDLS
jgi:hypothetical protein